MKKTRLYLLLVGAILISSLPAGAESIKIGFLSSFGGRLAVHGALSRQGAELAVQELNDKGGVLGSKIEAIFEDDKGDPNEAAIKARALAKEQKVDVLMGIISSEVALEVSRVANELQTPLIVTTAQTPAITGAKCNPYTFRVCRTSDGMIKTAVALARGLKVNEWNIVAPDYSFGHECWDMFRKQLLAASPRVKFAQSSNSFAPMSSTDWTPQIKQIMESGSDGVLIVLYAGNLVDFFKQGAKQGLFNEKRTFIALLGSLQTLTSLGIDMPKGIWFTPPYWYQAFENPVNKGFVSNYQAKYGVPPDYQAQFAYSGVMAYAEGLRKAGSPNKQAVIKALEGLETDLPMGRVLIRKEDHQAIFESYAGVSSNQVSVLETGSHRTTFRTLEKGTLFPASQISTPVEESDCKMR